MPVCSTTVRKLVPCTPRLLNRSAAPAIILSRVVEDMRVLLYVKRHTKYRAIHNITIVIQGQACSVRGCTLNRRYDGWWMWTRWRFEMFLPVERRPLGFAALGSVQAEFERMAGALRSAETPVFFGACRLLDKRW